VVHRDIKPENILLDAGRSMKLIDFGLAAFFAPGKKLRVHCGSPSYAAPEIVGRKLYEGPPVDVWSLGVVLFAMLAGFLPFHSSTGNKQELCQKIMAGTYNAPDYLSPSARDLLGRMLTVDPDARITLAEVAAHPWTRSSGPQWELPTTNCYSLSGTTSASGSGGMHQQQQQQHQVVLIPHGGTSSGSGAASGPQAAPDGGLLGVQASILEELEGHGCSRPAVLRYLAAGEANYMTASYYLLAEARAEAAAKLLPQKPWPFQPVVPHSSRSSASRSSTSRAAATSAAGQAGVGAPRPASGTTSSSRPASSGPAAAGVYLPRPATAVATPC
jgi:serine/threonine protein kinase